MTWPPELGRIADLLNERDEAAIAFEWYGAKTIFDLTLLSMASGASRPGIAWAMLMVAGVESVGIADSSIDARIEPYMVHICVRFDPMSMTNGRMNDADRDLLEAEVADVLYNAMPAGIGTVVTYETA